ncbi:MAG: transglutaminase-like domain-containing protein [Bacillota bacterium]|nr:transglutaminase-like domain-containing protein [Bacillota bacterium]
MNDKSVKQAEKLILIATIIIFVLLFFLKSTSPQFTLSSPVEAKAAIIEESAALVAVIEDETLPTFHEEFSPEQEIEKPLVAVLNSPNDAIPSFKEIGDELEIGLELATDTELFFMGEVSSRNLRVRVQVSNKGDTSSTNIRVEMPLLGNLDSPYQVLSKETYSHKPTAITEHNLGNRSASFIIPLLAPGAVETITVDYFLNVTPMTANLSSLPGSFRSGGQYVDPVYLLPADKIESDHPEIVTKAREVTAGSDNDLDKARDIYKFVIKYMKYDLNSSYRNSGALSALRTRSGVCEDYAALFVAFGRSEGIPARIVNGYADPKGRGEIWNVDSGKVFPLKGYRHSWAEFYLPGIGWIPVDPTMNIYDQNLTYFASLPQASHLAQNYQDQNMRLRYQGGQLAVIWGEELAG